MFWILIAIIYVNGCVDVSGYPDYHRKIGIPLAERIWQMEKKMMEGGNDGINERIIGGVPTTHMRYPWLAGLIIYDIKSHTRSVCGGSLISEKHVVTAAHCWLDMDTPTPSYVEIVLGSDHLYYGGTRADTYLVVTHPDWAAAAPHPPTHVDAAVITMYLAVTFSSIIRPVALPRNLTDETFSDYTAYAAGFGTIDFPNGTLPDVNYEVTLKIQAKDNCRSTTGKDHDMCTSGYGMIGVCVGDSGGPLTVRICGEHVLVGIIASVRIPGDCRSGYPSFHTRITAILDFVIQGMVPYPY